VRVECAKVTVPLDRTGLAPGQIALHVERSLASGMPRGVMLLVAGGPGQPSAGVFALRESAAGFHRLFPGYTLAAFDPRGTGQSSPLSCPGIQELFSTQTDDGEASVLAAACGAMLGDNRRFYSTRDHAEDLEAVREQLGVDRIAIWGTSYGTKLGLNYALAHPDRVERLLLDSALPPEGHKPFGGDTLQGLPAALSSFCAADACRAATPDFAGDVVRLANQLGAKPITGRVLVPGGSRVERLDGVQFLELVVEADLNPGVAAVLPAAVRAALRGDPRPLLRLNLVVGLGMVPTESLNAALFTATVCDDGPFPWGADTPVADRQRLIDAAIAALAPGSLGRFGTWATRFGNEVFCQQWPAHSAAPAFTPLPLPNVPVLVLAGDRDSRTPVSGASSVASRFPQGRLLVVPGVGHSVLSADLTGCAVGAVVTWMRGSEPPSRCDRSPAIVRPLAAFAGSLASLAPTGAAPGAAGRTLTAAIRTAGEAGAMWTLMALGFEQAQTTIAGLNGGRLAQASSSEAFSLQRYSIVPGVELSGQLKPFTSASVIFPFRFVGKVTVTGPKAARGSLVIERDRVRGTLGGRKVDVALKTPG
jgi:pimeloyl-ACP methyl ester carboxylesterase